MSALAPRAGNVFAAERASLKRPVAAAPVACGKMARDKFAHRVVAAKPPVQIVPAPPPPRHILAAKRLPAAAEAPPAEEAAKRRKTSSPSKPAATQAAHHRRAEPAKKQQPPLADQQQLATPATTQRPMASLIDKAMEVIKRRRRDEIALAREKFRRELLEVEKAATPDETIYPEDLEELGLTAFQYAVTPTRKQALARCRVNVAGA